MTNQNGKRGANTHDGPDLTCLPNTAYYTLLTDTKVQTDKNLATQVDGTSKRNEQTIGHIQG